MRYRLLLPTLALALLVLLASAAAAFAEEADGELAAADWVARKVTAGEDADFNRRCGTDPLDPHQADDPGWADPCRTLAPGPLRALLARPDMSTAPHGVRLRGAMIDGTLNLDDARVTAPELTLIDTRIKGDILLTDAHVSGPLDLKNTVITGEFKATRARFDSGVIIQANTQVVGPVTLHMATFKDSVEISDAMFDGGLAAAGVQADRFLGLAGIRITGAVELTGLKVGGGLSIDGTTVAGGKGFQAPLGRIGGFLAIHDVHFSGDVNLVAVVVDGSVVLQGVTVTPDATFNATGLRVAGPFTALQTVFGGDVTLDGAEIRDSAALSDVTVQGNAAFSAIGLRVGGTFKLIDPIVFPGGISLQNATIARDLDLTAMRVGNGKSFVAAGLRVGGYMVLNDARLGGSLSLRGADIAGRLMLDRAALTGPTLFERLRVGQDLFARDIVTSEPVNRVAVTAGSIDLRGARLVGLDLSDATIEGDLRFGGRWDNGFPSWTFWQPHRGAPPVAVLRNTRVGSLQDDVRAWDGAELSLQGFTYARLGGVGGTSAQDMRFRGVDAWRRWLERDPIYSPQPYTQLAAVLSAGGNGGDANDIRFAGRDRERTDKLRTCRWPAGDDGSVRAGPPCDVAGWVGLSLMQATIGYGIGAYTFRALWWTLLLAIVGTVVLLTAPGVRVPVRARRGLARLGGRRTKPVLWCFGASLNQILPVVTLSPEFAEFFNDPKGERLLPWQRIAFALLALAGWALSFFVVAALTGITQA